MSCNEANADIINDEITETKPAKQNNINQETQTIIQ